MLCGAGTLARDAYAMLQASGQECPLHTITAI
jgi:hypothetical protein